jgi:hypothetical protein
MMQSAEEEDSVISSLGDMEFISLEDLEIYTEDEMLDHGLLAVGWKHDEFSHLQHKTKVERFRSEYGARPAVLAQLWEDLQTTKVERANILKAKIRKLKLFFAAMHFLKRYPKETERLRMWKMSENTARRTCWTMVDCIGALKAVKIVWPDDNFGTGEWGWGPSVDGVHFHSEEKAHATLPKDPGLFSFKHNAAGFLYEIGLSMAESSCVWINGPFEAGTYNDVKVFREKGLYNKLKATKKRMIADGGYRGYPKIVSTPNPLDSEEVKLFKSRARMRHEKFNGTIKTFECLDSRFRHSKERLQTCFEAVVVVVQYMMEMGEPLYDI